jgi:thiamine kinase-like enzyme
MRAYHRIVADFRPPPDAVWNGGNRWAPGLIIGHNDAAPYNAAWYNGRLAGFFDWDLAGPVTPEWDLAFTALSWIPRHGRRLAATEGFTSFAARPRRLRQFLDVYGWSDTTADFLEVVRGRVKPER